MERRENGEKRIIKPIATKLKNNEKNCGITEKVLYPIVWAVEKLEPYLRGRTFHVITDHKAITQIKEKESFANKRMQRWLEKLQEYDFTLEYREGEEMRETDALSRIHEERNENEMEECQRGIIERIHEEIGHRGIELTEYEVRKQYTSWPKQREHIKKILNESSICARNKNKKDRGSEFIEKRRKFEIIGVDILDVKNTYVLMGIDYFTRYPIAKVVESKRAEMIIEVLEKWFKEWRNQEKLVMDKGREFENKWIEDLCIRRGIERHIVSTDHHKGNGRIERLNRTMR